jgi:hypothetical protein
MVVYLLGKTTSPPKYSPYPMHRSAILPLYLYRISFPYICPKLVCFKTVIMTLFWFYPVFPHELSTFKTLVILVF